MPPVPCHCANPLAMDVVARRGEARFVSASFGPLVGSGIACPRTARDHAVQNMRELEVGLNLDNGDFRQVVDDLPNTPAKIGTVSASRTAPNLPALHAVDNFLVVNVDYKTARRMA